MTAICFLNFSIHPWILGDIGNYFSWHFISQWQN
jgi:hypothetical protein